MPDMRIIVAQFTGPGVQFESWLSDGRTAGGVIELAIGGNQSQQHTAIVDAAKAAQTERNGVTFTGSDKIELWGGRTT